MLQSLGGSILGRTIVEAIKEVMLRQVHPMSPREAYEAIVRSHLYEFHAEDPLHIVQGQIRRHCQGVDWSSASRTKHFALASDGKYLPLSTPIQIRKHTQLRSRESTDRTTVDDLKRIHERYVNALRKRVLERLGKLDPTAFERFSKRLLDAYGFKEMVVTRKSRDGGIDGYGKLKVGLAHLNVAFQSKKWTGAVGRPSIDQFRGGHAGAIRAGYLLHDRALYLRSTRCFVPKRRRSDNLDRWSSDR